jgi:integrase/recombinase XerD
MSIKERAMAKAKPLNRWDLAVASYLSSRRALGRSYVPEEWVLDNVRKFLVGQGAMDLDEPLFDRWRQRSSHLSTSTRLRLERTVYKFCRYRRRSEPRCFVPDPLSFVRLRPYPLPTIIEPEQIVRLLDAAALLRPANGSPIYPAVARLAVVLLYTAGLRRGELVRLTLSDVDASAGVLRVRDSKFHKSRWVPLSRSARTELRAYLEIRRRAGFDQVANAPLLCTRQTRAYSGDGLGETVKSLCVRAKVLASTGRAPRIQDFRHSFAVAALLRWYQEGADVQCNLPKLALYMGHVSIVSTAYYLRLMPAVVEHASERFARACAGMLVGGAP